MDRLAGEELDARLRHFLSEDIGARDEKPEIVLPEEMRLAAERPLLRMLELS